MTQNKTNDSGKAENETALSFTGYWVIISFALLGGTAALSQSTILREAMVTFHGTELTIGAFYGSWFLWIAIGAWVSPKMSNFYGRHPKNFYVLLLAVFPIMLALQVFILRYWRNLTGTSPLEIITLEETLAGTFVGTSGCGFLMGALFPIATKLLGEKGNDSVSRIYMWEAIGSLVGGMAFTFVLATHLEPQNTMAAAFLVLGAGSAALAAKNKNRIHLISPGITLLLGVVLLSPAGAGINRLTEEIRWNSLQQGYQLESTLYSPYSHIALGRTAAKGKSGPSDYGVFYDGVLGETFPHPERFSRKAAHIVAQNPRAKRVLLMGGGIEGLAQELLKFPGLEKIDVVMLDPYAISAIKTHLTAKTKRALKDPRVSIKQTDPGRYLAEKCRPHQYDTVVSLFPRPTTVSLNRFFTQELFLDARVAVGDGAFVVFFSRDENRYVTEEERNSLGAIYKTLRSVFSQTTLLSGDIHYMAGSIRKSLLAQDTETLSLRYGSLELEKWPYPPDAFPGRGINKEASRRLQKSLSGAQVRINYDQAPSALFHGMVYIGGLSRSKLLPLLKGLRNTGPLLFFALLVLGFSMGALRRLSDPNPEKDKKRLSRLAIASVGFSSMTLQVTVLVSFSARHGSLYREMGVLTGVLMTGLALGALVGRKLKYISRSSRLELTAGVALMGLLAWALPFILGAVGETHGVLGRATFGVLSLLIGFITGAVFPLGVRHHDPLDKAASLTASFLNAADNMGAMFGGLFAGTLWLPIFGMNTTCHFAAVALTGTVGLMLIDTISEKWNLREKPTPAVRWTFPWKNFSWTFASITVLVVGGSAVVSMNKDDDHRQSTSETEVEGEIQSQELRAEYRRHIKRKGVKVIEELEPFPHLKIMWKGRVAEVVFSSKHTAGDVRGYGGPVELIIRMKSDGTILETQLGRHKETPSYIREVPRWLKKFQNHPPGKPILGQKGVDSVSGATVTTDAIKQIVAKSRTAAMNKLLDLEGPAACDAQPSVWAKALKSLSFWGMALFALFALIAYLRATPGLRMVSLISGFLILGIWLTCPLTVIDLGQISQGELPAFPLKILSVGVALILAVLFGQVWCGYMCPFGAAQELIWLAIHPRGFLSERGFGQADRVSKKLEQKARYTKFLLLGLVLSAYAITKKLGFLSFDPMSWVFTADLNLWRWVLLSIITIGAVVLFRPWCRYICPVGALLALSNKLSFLDLKKGPNRRINHCDIGVTSLKHADCIRCNRCIKKKTFF